MAKKKKKKRLLKLQMFNALSTQAWFMTFIFKVNLCLAQMCLAKMSFKSVQEWKHLKTCSDEGTKAGLE